MGKGCRAGSLVASMGIGNLGPFRDFTCSWVESREWLRPEGPAPNEPEHRDGRSLSGKDLYDKVSTPGRVGIANESHSTQITKDGRRCSKYADHQGAS